MKASDTYTSKSHVTNLWMWLTHTKKNLWLFLVCVTYECAFFFGVSRTYECGWHTPARIMSQHTHSHTTYLYACDRIVDTRTWMHLSITHMNVSDTHTYECVWHTHIWMCLTHTHMNVSDTHTCKNRVTTITHDVFMCQNESLTHTYECVWHTHIWTRPTHTHECFRHTHMNASDALHQKLLGSGFPTPMSPLSLVCTFSFELNGNVD